MYVGPNLSSCLLLCRWCLAFGRKIIQSEEDFPDSVWINKRLSELVNSEQDILCCEQLSGNLRIICLALIRDCDDALTNTGNINSRKLHTQYVGSTCNLSESSRELVYLHVFE